MKNAILFLSLLFCGTISFAQVDNSHINFQVSTTKNATYPGGDSALYRYFYDEMKFPEAAKEAKIDKDVYVSFFVEADGSCSDIKVMSDPGYGVGEEATRLIKGLKFSPAIQNGKPVRQNMMLSIPFRYYQ